MTNAELASALEVSASTVSRSLSTGGFSYIVEARASAALKENGALWHSPAAVALRRAAREDASGVDVVVLHKLRIIAHMLSEVQTALDALLDPGQIRR